VDGKILLEFIFKNYGYNVVVELGLAIESPYPASSSSNCADERYFKTVALFK
jgi:hypothetical protein